MEITKYRKFYGLTQQEMAQRLNISSQAYWNKENGRTPFNDKEKIFLKEMIEADFPNVTYEELFFNKKVTKGTS